MTLVLGLAVALFALGLLGVPKALSMDADDFMAPAITSCVNGLFISIVFLSHAKDYVPEEAFGPLDEGCLKVVSYLGQLMVTTFLFYSGFGAMESIKHKPGYIKAFPARRILPFLLDVWIALAVYLVLLPIRGGQTNVETVLLAMVGWKSLGNSNWYIFAILPTRAATYLAFRVFPDEKQRPLGVALVTVLSLLYAWVLRHDEIGSHFYKTIVCYPAGMALSLVVERVRSLKLDSLRMLPVWALLFVGSVAALVYLHGKRRGARIPPWEAWQRSELVLCHDACLLRHGAYAADAHEAREQAPVLCGQIPLFLLYLPARSHDSAQADSHARSTALCARMSCHGHSVLPAYGTCARGYQKADLRVGLRRSAPCIPSDRLGRRGATPQISALRGSPCPAAVSWPQGRTDCLPWQSDAL